MENNKGFFKNLLQSRSLRYGSNSLILIAIVVAIAVFVNVLVGMADLKLDLTPNKLFSVSDTTKDILKGLKTEVTVLGLFDDEKVTEYKEITELLKQYEKYENIDIQYKDPDKNPGLISDLDPENVKKISRNDFVVKSGKKMKVISTYDLFEYQMNQDYSQSKVGTKAEQAFTSAIKYVTAEKTPTVYFMEGHNEADFNSEYSTARQYIEMNNFEVKSLNLITSEKVPEDAEILIALSPKSDLATPEADKVREYLKNGGKAIFMIDPVEKAGQFTQFDSILSDFNVALNYDKVKENDADRHIKGDATAIVPDVQSNAITSNIGPENLVMLMPKARSINVLKNQKEYITTTSLIKSSKKAEGELIDKSQGENLQGPLDLAVAVENKGNAKTSKIIVMGNSLYMSDSVFSQGIQGGMLFFLNSINWMSEIKDDTMIQPKTYDSQKLEMTAAQSNISAVVVLVIFPLLILGLGTFVWLRRRHL
ncbi:MAG: Gldg family protein [Clostridia bacterium]|nr:Gldg family protein [Clostridia bacterium]